MTVRQDFYLPYEWRCFVCKGTGRVEEMEHIDELTARYTGEQTVCPLCEGRGKDGPMHWATSPQ